MNANVAGTFITFSLWYIRSDAAVLSSAPEAADSLMRKPMESLAPTKETTQLAQSLSSFTAWVGREKERKANPRGPSREGIRHCTMMQEF